MTRQAISLTLATLALLLALFQATAGEPRPGLEIFDGGADIETPPPLVVDRPPQPIDRTGPPPAVIVEPITSDPGYFTGGTPFRPAPPTSVADTTVDPFPEPQRTAPPPDVQPARPYGEAQYPGMDPASATLENINTINPNFAGVDAAVAQGDLRGVGAIVWQVLKERRIVDATLARGPGASAGTSSSYEYQIVFDAINFQPGASMTANTPLTAAYRVNVILDAFSQPIVEDPGFGNVMDTVLTRLYNDIYAVSYALAETSDEAAYQELARTYIRAATTCDFFVFPRRQFATDVNEITARSATLFYPDGASIGGDVAGVTGNMFHNVLMLEQFTLGDSWFRRSINSLWRTMDRPARYVLDVACPDMTLPRFGPRGSRELTPMELARLEAIFPKPEQRFQRLGLAASASFPERSDFGSFGGIFVSRSGMDPGARYLAIRYGPAGCLNSVPAHYDFGSMVLMSRNIKFIVDAGGYGGDAAGPAVHSGLSLAGEYVMPSTYNAPAEPVDTVWRTNASIDYVTDQAGFANGKSWQRTLLYVKDSPGETLTDYWLVLDHVDMNNDNQPRQAHIRYQLAPGIQAYHDGSGILATPGFGYGDQSALRFFAIDAGTELTVSEGGLGLHPSHVYDISGGSYAAPSVNMTRTLVGNSTTATLIYPCESVNQRPVRIERDADIIRGRTGAIVIDHGLGRIDVIAWAPPGTELVTPTLNLQLSADMAVFKIRNGKIARMSFVNLERFQAKEPEGGMWSMRVNGSAQTLTLEPDSHRGWQVLSDPANKGGATLYDINLGPAIANRRLSIRPGDMKVITR